MLVCGKKWDVSPGSKVSIGWWTYGQFILEFVTEDDPSLCSIKGDSVIKQELASACTIQLLDQSKIRIHIMLI
jgi:hypothetical protein